MVKSMGELRIFALNHSDYHIDILCLTHYNTYTGKLKFLQQIFQYEIQGRQIRALHYARRHSDY